MPEQLPSLQELYDSVDSCLSADRLRLLGGLRKLRQRQKKRQPYNRDLKRLAEQVAASKDKVEHRRKNIPAIAYPEELPISARRDDIAEAIRDHQVVVVAGETGSGKTTQLPKICLELGRGARGLIGHTQPRRIAARTVANRIAEELNTPLGEKVGYQVRFTDQSSDNTYIKLMTDGILLAEIQTDRYLDRYDTIIIDEAHERSLNIDFLLGYLKRILPKRPDLKIIITSATIDVERFSQHFDGAPVVEVSGRTYPVETRYRPLAEGQDDLNQAILDAIEELLNCPQRGDILVFLSGERDIREAAQAIRKAQLPHVEVLPLYARLSLAEQSRVFQRHGRGVRVVLATNVAETSITVPGIRYVIDPGTARISRYSFRTKVQRLPVEAISQASANQRKGRCGRLSDGVCIRLYTEEDYLNRAEFTDPEIVRTNLAAVILQMLHLRIGDIRNFDFVDAPDRRLINDGFNLLQELGAVDGDEKLTPVGRQLCRLPVDPRLGRMLLAAEAEGFLREMLVVVAALSIQDPRERPADKKQAADQAHAQWKDKSSDFMALLNLWNHMETQRQELSRNMFSRYCHKHFVSYLRMREWRDLHHQLHHSVRELGLRENTGPADYRAIHRALLAGLLGHIGYRDGDREYQGTRNRTFHIFPGSALFKTTPRWVMCGELLETSRLYAHNVAAIESEWLPELAAHLVKKNYSEPHYDARSGQVMAFEKQTLYGLTIVDRQRCPYGAIDPDVARQVFIQGALVEGRYRGKGCFFAHNQQLLKELEDMEARVRRRDIVVDDGVLYAFFDERVPQGICSLVLFEQWRQEAEGAQPRLLYMDRELLAQRTLGDSTEAQFPDHIDWQGVLYPLSYHFEPGHPEDGVTATLPLTMLHCAPGHRFEWLVPGMLRDKCISLVKSLPKSLRRHFVPVPDYVDKAMRDLKPDNKALTAALAVQLQRLAGVELSPGDWREDQLDDYYRMNFRLVDEHGETLAMARDLGQLQAQYRGAVQDSIRQAADPAFEREGITQWDFGELPKVYRTQTGGVGVQAWPALLDRGDSVALALLDHPEAARNLSWCGVLRLAVLQHSQAQKYLRKQLLKGMDLQLLAAGLPKRNLLVERLIDWAYREALFAEQQCSGTDALPRNESAFKVMSEAGRGQIVACANAMEELLLTLLDSLISIRKRLKRQGLEVIHAVQDIHTQLDGLFSQTRFLGSGPHASRMAQLRQYPRYLKAIQNRLDKLGTQLQKDKQHTQELAACAEKLEAIASDSTEWTQNQAKEVAHYEVLLQEYRVSLFAQHLKTAVPVSAKRLQTQWQAVCELCSQANA